VAFLPQALFMAVLSTGITAKLVNRFGAKVVMYPGMAMAAIGLVLLASAGQHASYFPQIFLAFLLLGAGAGLSFMPLLQIGMSEVPSDDAGLGSGVVNVSQQMAGAIGLAVLSTIAANRTKSLVASGQTAIHSLTLGYQMALYIAAGCVLVGLLVSPILLRTDESPEEQAAHMAENMQNPETKEHLIL
jgi:MFS family permease